MRKLYLLIVLLTLSSWLQAQTFVNTNAQLRNAVLEEYTGIHCTYCPEGHAISQAIHDSVPTRVVLLYIHQGSFSTPSGAEPDFRTPFGDALAGQTGLTGYPSGTVNRHLFPGTSETALGRGAWRDAANQILSYPSPVNAGFQSQYDSVTRQLTVTVEVYYTSSSPQNVNFINVALTQNHVYGPQTGGNAGNNYDHKHALRYLLTGQWGDSVTTTTKGSFVTRTYVYTVPLSYNNIPCNVNNCDISVFVSEGHQEIYTGVSGPAIGGSSDGTTALYIGSLTSNPMILEGVPAVISTFDAVITSSLLQPEDFTINMVTDAPNDWTSSFTVNGSTYTSSGTVNIAEEGTMNMTINVTPGATPAFANYVLTLSSVSNPQAPSQVLQISLISGITDLIVRGSGSWGDGGSHGYDQVYPAAMAATGCTTFGSTTSINMVRGFNGNVMNNVKNMYFDIGWRFPAFTDDEATAVMNFLDNGGNVFVAGQDIGWEIMGGSGYETVITQNLYTNYLHASYTADGSGANSPLTANTGDAIFGGIASSPVFDFYGGGMVYPDQLNTTASGIPIMYYNNLASKIAALRYNNATYKTVYVGVGLEMLSNTVTQNNIIKQSYDWFNGMISSIEPDDFQSVVNVCPNPATDRIRITFETKDATDVKVEFSDILGNILIHEKIKNTDRFSRDLDVRHFAPGVYFVRLSHENATKTYKINISR